MKKILYLFDDINYPSGAQKVTLFQMEMLKNRYDISVFSMTPPSKKLLQKNMKFVCQEVWNQYKILGQSFTEVMKSKQVSISKKLWRMLYSCFVRLGFGEKYVKYLLYRQHGKELEQFDSVIVVSEASKLRALAGKLKHPGKIQWIHTDYSLWSDFSDWTRAVTKKDKNIYKNFDYIVTLSEHSRKGLIQKIPELEEKTIVIPNLINGEEILKKAKEDCPVVLDDTITNLVTVGRLEKEKALDRVLNICGRWKKEQKAFCWYIVGDGSLKKHLEKRIQEESLTDVVKLLGVMENPYPLMKRCDFFVLLSEYEGTPVTIDEAMVLGIAVVARNVGGIEEQVERLGGETYRNLNEKILQELQRIIE